jgi:hypothetical protein
MSIPEANWPFLKNRPDCLPEANMFVSGKTKSIIKVQQ